MCFFLLLICLITILMFDAVVRCIKKRLNGVDFWIIMSKIFDDKKYYIKVLEIILKINKLSYPLQFRAIITDNISLRAANHHFHLNIISQPLSLTFHELLSITEQEHGYASSLPMPISKNRKSKMNNKKLQGGNSRSSHNELEKNR